MCFHLQEELLHTLNKMKTKLEKETAALIDTKASMLDATARLTELQQMVCGTIRTLVCFKNILSTWKIES